MGVARALLRRSCAAPAAPWGPWASFAGTFPRCWRACPMWESAPQPWQFMQPGRMAQRGWGALRGTLLRGCRQQQQQQQPLRPFWGEGARGAVLQVALRSRPRSPRSPRSPCSSQCQCFGVGAHPPPGPPSLQQCLAPPPQVASALRPLPLRPLWMAGCSRPAATRQKHSPASPLPNQRSLQGAWAAAVSQSVLPAGRLPHPCPPSRVCIRGMTSPFSRAPQCACRGWTRC